MPSGGSFHTFSLPDSSWSPKNAFTSDIRCTHNMPCVHIRTKNRVMKMEMKRRRKKQHQPRRSSSMTKSNRNTPRPFLADAYFRLPLQCRTKNEMCSARGGAVDDCIAHMHIDRTHAPIDMVCAPHNARSTLNYVEHRSLVSTHARCNKCASSSERITCARSRMATATSRLRLGIKIQS